MNPETPPDRPMPRNLKAYRFSDGQGRAFDVVAADFNEAIDTAIRALDGRRPIYARLNCSLPGVNTHVLQGAV
jgi:hypothetical protein